jgi:hypothetical protein
MTKATLLRLKVHGPDRWVNRDTPNCVLRDIGFPISSAIGEFMANTAMQPPLTQRIPAWVNIVVVLCAVLMAAGALIAFVKPGMLVDPHAEINEAVRTYAGYLTARNLTLAVMLIVLLFAGARRALGNLVAVVGFIQLFDFVVDCTEARWSVAPGVLVLGVLLLLAAQRLMGAPFWRRAAWV